MHYKKKIKKPKKEFASALNALAETQALIEDKR